MTLLDISESQHPRFSCRSNVRAHSLTGSQPVVAGYPANVQLVTGTASPVQHGSSGKVPCVELASWGLVCAATAKFDAVFCGNALHHVKAIPTTVHSMASVLRHVLTSVSFEPNTLFQFWQLMPYMSSGFNGAFRHGTVRCRKAYLTETCLIAAGTDLPMARRNFRSANPKISDFDSSSALKPVPFRDCSFFLILRCMA